MRKVLLIGAILSCACVCVRAQEESAPEVKVITLDDAIRIALTENETVKIADMDIEKAGYAKKGTYASLFPQVDGTGSYQRTIKKQVMYMDFTTTGSSSSSSSSESSTGTTGASAGIEVGRSNTWSAGVSASMPLVNAQLWESIRISAQDVELAVEKARGSRLDMVTQVKQAYYGVLLAKESFNVYKEVYENALANCELTQKKYNAQKASELDLTRAKTSVANAIPNVYDSENSVILGLWQLKALMGMDLDENIDIAGSIMDYADQMSADLYEHEGEGVEDNSSLRQLAIQAEELASTLKMQKLAYAPSLSLAFSYAINAMANDFVFKDYRWSPYSYVGLSLSIPIFAGGKRLSNVKKAQVQLDEMKLQQASTERQLRIAIRQYLNTMETSLRTYEAANDALGTAEKAYSIAEKSYGVGRSTLTDLNDARLSLTQAQLNVCQSIYKFVVAKSNLEQTIGADYTEE